MHLQERHQDRRPSPGADGTPRAELSPSKKKRTDNFWCYARYFYSVRLSNEYRHQGAAALTRNELALDHFLGFRRARRKIKRSYFFRSSAHNRFRLACQLQPQGFEDCRPLRGHWVGWITNHFAGNMAAPIRKLTRIFEFQGDRRFGGLCRPSRVVLHHRRQSDRRWRNERLRLDFCPSEPVRQLRLGQSWRDCGATMLHEGSRGMW